MRPGNLLNWNATAVVDCSCLLTFFCVETRSLVSLSLCLRFSRWERLRRSRKHLLSLFDSRSLPRDARCLSSTLFLSRLCLSPSRRALSLSLSLSLRSSRWRDSVALASIFFSLSSTLALPRLCLSPSRRSLSLFDPLSLKTLSLSLETLSFSRDSRSLKTLRSFSKLSRCLSAHTEAHLLDSLDTSCPRSLLRCTPETHLTGRVSS